MAEPIDHAAEAARLVEPNPFSGLPVGSAELAQVHATLALVAAQDRANELSEEANELKRVEILALLNNGDTHLAGDAYAALALRRPPTTGKGWQHVGFAPSVAAALGLGGESDGE